MKGDGLYGAGRRMQGKYEGRWVFWDAGRGKKRGGESNRLLGKKRGKI